MQDLTQLSLPPAIAYLSAGKLSEDGIFLLENGFEAYLHSAPRVAPDLLIALLGPSPSCTAIQLCTLR